MDDYSLPADWSCAIILLEKRYSKQMTPETSIVLELDRIIQGDSLTALASLPDSCINLIFTSPPYADNRKNTYKGIPIKEYVEWFLPISNELKRVLKNDGTFVLNIKERTENGERQTYVLELILAMGKQGWLWTEEYIWHKKNCYPGKWPNRFRDAWERCLQFNKQKKFKMLQEAVMVPIGGWSEKRLSKLSATDLTRDESKVGSGFGKNVSNWLGRRFVYPTNVLHLATECANRGHSASFPLALPTWFIKLFTQEGDVVLDPFIGSGTTAIACLELNRHYIGIEAMDNYYKLAHESIEKWKAANNGHSGQMTLWT
jgi:DNA modification methylase